MALRQKEDYFSKLLEKFAKKFIKALKIDWGVGGAISITNAKILGKKTNANPLALSNKDQKANINIINNLVKDVNLEMSKKINNIVNQGIAEGWGHKEVSKQLKGIFDESSTNYFNYKNRFESMGITESTRILNTSIDKNAKRLGAKKKYLLGVNDAKQGSDSKVALSKYGSPEKAIPVDEPFNFVYRNKQFIYMIPPNRPRDREQPVYLFE